MDNSSQSLDESTSKNTRKASWPLIIIIIVLLIAIGIAWQFTGNKPEPVVSVPQLPVIEEVVEEQQAPIIVEPVIEQPEIEIVEEVTEPIETKPVLPSLNESDDWLKIKLPEITWRKELLKLIIDEDMIRRFVVFTDNFAQGNVAYEHSPFILPKEKFAPVDSETGVQDGQQVKHKVWQWNEEASNRYTLYVELLRSMDSETLAQWYLEIKPLINEAYSELGYEDDFTNTLQDAITRVLDMELPKTSMALIQPSVMYKYANPKLESLPDSDKLLLRLGKDNLLVMKSVLLELHEKLAQQQNGVH